MQYYVADDIVRLQSINGGGGDMGNLWGECESSRREMILSVLTPGHLDIGGKKEGYYILIY